MNNDNIKNQFHQIDSNIPTRDEICIYNSLDERMALKHFLHRSADEIENYFKTEAGEAAFYGEDLLHMGPRAFQYYFPAYRHYLESTEAEDDFETAQSIIGTIKQRYKHEKSSLVPIKEEVLQCLDYLVNHPVKFNLEGEFKAVLEEGKHMLKAVARL